MPDAPGSSPKQSAPPVAAAAHPASRDSGSDQTPPPDQPPQATTLPLLSLSLGTLSVVLLALVLVFATKVSTRDKTLTQNQNRAEQHEAATTLLRAQLDKPAPRRRSLWARPSRQIRPPQAPGPGAWRASALPR